MRLNKILEILKERGITQSWLAGKIGKSANAVNSICNNKSQPRLETLYEIATVLNVKVCELLVMNEVRGDSIE